MYASWSESRRPDDVAGTRIDWLMSFAMGTAMWSIERWPVVGVSQRPGRHRESRRVREREDLIPSVHGADVLRVFEGLAPVTCPDRGGVDVITKGFEGAPELLAQCCFQPWRAAGAPRQHRADATHPADVKRPVTQGRARAHCVRSAEIAGPSAARSPIPVAVLRGGWVAPWAAQPPAPDRPGALEPTPRAVLLVAVGRALTAKQWYAQCLLITDNRRTWLEGRAG